MLHEMLHEVGVLHVAEPLDRIYVGIFALRIERQFDAARL